MEENGDPTLDIPKCTLIVAGLTWFGLGMSIDWLMTNEKDRDGIHYTDWIVNLCLASFLLSTGLLFHHFLTFCRNNWLTFFGEEDLASAIRSFIDVRFQTK